MPSRQQLEDEVLRLKDLRADVEKDWLRLRYIPIFCLAAIPAYFVMDIAGAVGAIISVFSILIPSAYLLGTRRLEYDSDIRTMEDAITEGKYDPPSDQKSA